MNFQTTRISRECGTCTENCPVEVLNEFTMNAGFRKAIFVSFSQAVVLLCIIVGEHCLKHVQAIVGVG
jgi:heterodisulfide reductase subunit A-like polyferredoxin